MSSAGQLALSVLLLGTWTGAAGFSTSPALGIRSSLPHARISASSTPRLINKPPSSRVNGSPFLARGGVRMQGLATPPASEDLSQSKVGAKETETLQRESFDFTQQWYPMAVAEFIDEKKPYPIQLLGKELVVWKDMTTGKWSVFEDACPHRLAPLSEGRVEPDGTLLCAYHAWTFDSSGACRNIPHAQKERNADLCKLPKACAVSHPVMEVSARGWMRGGGESKYGKVGGGKSTEVWKREQNPVRRVVSIVAREGKRTCHLPNDVEQTRD